jgi:hypothetical protein
MLGETPRIIIHLCFVAHAGDPTRISETLGMSPTSAHSNQVVVQHSRAVNKKGLWVRELYNDYCYEIGNVIEKIINKLIEKKELISEIASESIGDSYLSVSVSFSEKAPSLYVLNNVIRDLADMNLDLDIDIFHNA